MKKIKKVLEFIGYNIWPLVGFEAGFKVISFLIFTPLFFHIFDSIMKVTGYHYLTLENVFSFLINPITFVMLLLLILLMTIYAMFDIMTIIIILDGSYQKKKVKVVDAIRISLQKCRKILKLENIPLAFLVLFMIPFLNLGLASSFISTIKIPEFINEFIFQNAILLPIFTLVIILLSIIFYRWLYSLHYFVLEDISFKEARKKSSELGKKHHMKDWLSVVLVQFALGFLYFLFVILGIVIIIGLDKALENIILKSITTTVILIFIAFSFLIVTILSTPISYATISVLYYLRKESKKESIQNISFHISKENKATNVKLRKLAILFYSLAILFGSIFTYGIYKGSYNLNIEHIRRQEVTAHRGSSLYYPENTMSAFKAAKEEGADWIELDVQQTKDGRIIVAHDTSFKRTAGMNKHTWELTYEEIKELDVGSFKDEKFKGEKVPLLEEVILFAKENNIQLNIELKPSGHEVDFEKSVIDIINQYSFRENCVVTSQVYDVLKRIKNYDPKMETVYVMSFAYGDIIELKDADHFSIEATSITSSLVSKIHKEGKEISAWTVNTEENMKRLIELKVDNIITDNVELAKNTIYSSRTSNLINEYAEWVEKIF